MGVRALKRILAVDDDPDVLELVTLWLGKYGGYAVATCSSGREAVERAREFRPDLILLDVMMPGVDGFRTLKSMRASEPTARTPVVFMTALVQQNDIAHYEELGCLGVIPKPVDLTALPEMLNDLWARKRRAPAKRPVEKQFAALRREYMRGVNERIGVMRAEARSLAQAGWDRQALDSLYHLAHRMAGSSGLYQLPALSRSASALEDILKRMLSSPSWPPASPPSELSTLVKAVALTARKELRSAAPARTSAHK